jgi:Ser/Thr protein kinase RdoA (MazF antagonist)
VKNHSSLSWPPLDLCLHWGLQSPRLLSERVNTHWRVTSRQGAAVLRRYGADMTHDDIEYEVRIADQLADAGWPVPKQLEPSIHWDGRWWGLFGLLPGQPRSGPGEDHRRGRLLADLHATTSTFPAVQRRGWSSVRDVMLDPKLGDAVRFIERHFPRQGRILLWHFEIAAGRFAEVTGSAPMTVIHGDFNSRNLLFVDGQLSGILDFEATHLDYRVADFALSWRATRDDVVLGYHEVAPLSEVEWHLLVPCLWAWAFLGVRADVERMQRGERDPNGFDWQVNHLLRRSPLMGEYAAPCL